MMFDGLSSNEQHLVLTSAIAALRNDAAASVRTAAADLLGLIGRKNRSVIRALKASSNDEDENQRVRQHAEHALGRLKSPPR